MPPPPPYRIGLSLKEPHKLKHALCALSMPDGIKLFCALSMPDGIKLFWGLMDIVYHLSWTHGLDDSGLSSLDVIT